MTDRCSVTYGLGIGVVGNPPSLSPRCWSGLDRPDPCRGLVEAEGGNHLLADLLIGVSLKAHNRDQARKAFGSELEIDPS